MLHASRIILNAYKYDDFQPFMIFGKQRRGKSAYTLIVLREVYGTWDAWKKYMVFKPQEFFQKINSGRKKEPLLVWDDAGVWLYAYKWKSSMMQLVGQYMSLVGTRFASIMLTTPDPRWVLKKVRNMPEMVYGMPVRIDEYRRKIDFYKEIISPNIVIRNLSVSKDMWMSDEYDLRVIPRDVYEEYYQVRKKYIAEVEQEQKKWEKDFRKEIIRRMLEEGISQVKIARILGLSPSRVTQIKKEFENESSDFI